MRAIPDALKSALESKLQKPSMKIIAGRDPKNLFIVETIHEKSGLNTLDTSLKRLNSESKPAEAYVVFIDNGIAKLKKKDLPYDPETPWIDLFTIGNATDVAIEFNGYWEKDPVSLKFNFVTDEYPWLFYIQKGDIKAQYWTDEPVTLASNVTKLAAIRGWIPANGEQHNDQGLILAYLKPDGKAYYRNYCTQADLTFLWEVERVLTQFGEGITGISLFRTNDFRIGFIAEKQNAFEWILTSRNWAGMSVPSEKVAMTITDVDIRTYEIQYKTGFSPAENVSMNFNPLDFVELHVGLPTDSASIIGSGFIDEHNFYIQWNCELLNPGTLLGHITANQYNITNVGFGDTNSKLKVTVADTLKTYISIAVNYDGAGLLRTQIRMGNRPKVPTFSYTVTGVPPEVIEYVTMLPAPNITALLITYKEGFFPSNDAYVSVQPSLVTIVVTQVAYNPL